MNHFLWSLLWIFAVLNFERAACQKKALSGLSAQLAFKYLKAINRPDDNVLFSPSTLLELYAMVYMAADGQLKQEVGDMVFAGWSEQEIYAAMANYARAIARINNGANIRLASANKIYYQADEPVAAAAAAAVLPSRDLSWNFSTVFESTSPERVDFSNQPDLNRMIINQWISEKTGRKIERLFTSNDVTSDTVMLLASGAALDGDFTYGFSSKNVFPRLFFSSASTANLIQGMTTTCSRFFYGQTSRATVVGLPYGLRERVIVFFITTRNRSDRLSDLEEFLSQQDQLSDLLDNTVDYSRVVTVTMPKFKLVSDAYDTRVAFMLMGTTTMFANGFADFSKINNRKNLYVTGARHSAFFETKEGMARLCPKDDDSGLLGVDVSFNQPFLIVALEKTTRSLLFYGRVTSVYS